MAQACDPVADDMPIELHAAGGLPTGVDAEAVLRPRTAEEVRFKPDKPYLRT